jgi:hypothetical protein
VPTVLKNLEKVGNLETPFSRSGKSGKMRASLENRDIVEIIILSTP